MYRRLARNLSQHQCSIPERTAHYLTTTTNNTNNNTGGFEQVGDGEWRAIEMDCLAAKVKHQINSHRNLVFIVC